MLWPTPRQDTSAKHRARLGLAPKPKKDWRPAAIAAAINPAILRHAALKDAQGRAASLAKITENFLLAAADRAAADRREILRIGEIDTLTESKAQVVGLRRKAWPTFYWFEFFAQSGIHRHGSHPVASLYSSNSERKFSGAPRVPSLWMGTAL
jgi:hypothetical protein